MGIKNWERLRESVNVHDSILIGACEEVLSGCENEIRLDLTQSPRKLIVISIPILRRLVNLAKKGENK